MMAHDAYNLMISLAFDGLLTEEEEQELHQHIRTCDVCTMTWEHMSLLDTTLTAQVEVSPPPGFALNVMTRIESYNARRRWYPWLVTSLTVFSLMAALNITVLLLLFLPALYEPLLEWTVVGGVIDVITQGFSWIQVVIDFATTALGNWFTFLTANPAVLAVVLMALVFASIWIGLLEGLKSTAVPLGEAATSRQSA